MQKHIVDELDSSSSYKAPHRLPAIRSALPIIVAAFAVAANAEVYRLDPELAGSSGPVNEFSSPSIWRVFDTSTESYVNTESIPQAGDAIEMGDYNIKNSKPERTNDGKIRIDNDYTVANFTKSYNKLRLYSSENTTHSLTITGEIGGGSYQYFYINSGATLVASASSILYGAWWDSTPTYVYILNGGEVDVLGAISSCHINWDIPTGATLRLSPTVYTNFLGTTSAQRGDVFNLSGGTMYVPNGLSVVGGASDFANTINQSSGLVSFGGNFTSEASWIYTFSGGTLAVTDNSAFGQNIALTIPASASVTFDVASDKTFSAANFAADSTAAITKTGAGTFAYAPTAASIAVNAGGIGFASASTYDLSNVSFASGTQIALNALGATISATSATIDNATFVAALPSAAGPVLSVSDSSLAAVLTKAHTDLTAPAGYALVIDASGTTLSLEKDTGAANTFSTTGDLLSSECWGGGSVPGDDSEVSISGDGVVATYSGGTIPSWTSITVKNGATLRISANATLPPVILNMSAALVVANDATMTLANASDLSGIATAQQIPVLSIASGATLSVPGGMKFSNVDIDLMGTLAVSPSGTITFGYAGAGETTYIGFHSVGGKITNSVLWDYDLCRIGMCCPEQGGTVVAPDPLVFKDMPVIGEYLPTYSDNYWNGFSLGVNNPENIAFEVVFDNTKWNASGNLYVKGGATFRLKNGSMYMNDETYSLYNRHAEMSGNGRIVIESDSVLRLDAMGNSGNTATVINATTPGHDSIIVSGGGIYDNYRTTGNGNGIFVASNAVITVHVPFIDEDVTGSSGTTHYCNTNILFEGFSSVSLATNSTLTLTTRNSGSSVSHFSDASGDRVVSLADVPITGGGSVALSNANVNVFGVIVKSGANTASGTASVVDPEAGIGATTLYFADGANWAGTVVAGNVSLTNLTGGVSAANVDFGTLDLAGDFQIRVWTDNDGSIVTNDMLNVGTYVNNGGRLAPISAADGEAFAPAGRIVVGKINKDSPSLPTAIRGWSVKTLDVLGDDANYLLTLKPSSGLQIILR